VLSFYVAFLDIAAFLAAKAVQVVAPEVIAKKREDDQRKNCRIITFGDYYGSEWVPGLTFFYK
jgi:hypothetical protein